MDTHDPTEHAAGPAGTEQEALIGVPDARPKRHHHAEMIPPLEMQIVAESSTVDGDRPGVLLIEDDVLDRSLFLERLSKWGYAVSSHPSVEAAMSSGPHEPDIVLIDLGLPGVNGWDGVRTIRASQPNCPVIVLTGHAAPGLAETAIDSGAHDYVWKDDPDPDALDRTIRRALHRSAFARVEQFDAMHDPLTGLPNRALLDDRMSTLAAIADRNGTKLGVLFIDLDRFKPVNDRYGHHVGDRLLVDFARRAASVMRPSDTVARIGGDEFVVLVGNVADDTDVEHVARRLADSLNAPYRDPEIGEIEVRASIGVASGRPAEVMPSTLLVLADRACLDAKGHAEQAIRWSLVRGLAALVEQDEPMPIEVHYRPIMEGRAVIGREAFARLVEPDGTLMRPGDFLHGVRLAGRLPELDLTVLRTALRDADPMVTSQVTVNLSVETLRNRAAIDEIEALLAGSAAAITFDVSERALRSDDRADEGLARLRSAGARIAVDDFGSGSADVLELVDVEIDEVKLHPRFVEMLGEGERSVPVIEALVLVCDRLGLSLVVTGIETTEQLLRFDALGAPRWQGPLAGAPAPAPRSTTASPGI